jgi:hypothetical protein
MVLFGENLHKPCNIPERKKMLTTKFCITIQVIRIDKRNFKANQSMFLFVKKIYTNYGSSHMNLGGGRPVFGPLNPYTDEEYE